MGDGILDAGFGAIPVGADQLDLDVLQGKRLRRSRFSGDFHGDGLFRTVIEGHEDFFCGGAAGKTLVGGEGQGFGICGELQGEKTVEAYRFFDIDAAGAACGRKRAAGAFCEGDGIAEDHGSLFHPHQNRKLLLATGKGDFGRTGFFAADDRMVQAFPHADDAAV